MQTRQNEREAVRSREKTGVRRRGKPERDGAKAAARLQKVGKRSGVLQYVRQRNRRSETGLAGGAGDSNARGEEAHQRGMEQQSKKITEKRRSKRIQEKASEVTERCEKRGVERRYEKNAPSEKSSLVTWATRQSEPQPEQVWNRVRRSRTRRRRLRAKHAQEVVEQRAAERESAPRGVLVRAPRHDVGLEQQGRPRSAYGDPAAVEGKQVP